MGNFLLRIFMQIDDMYAQQQSICEMNLLKQNLMIFHFYGNQILTHLSNAIWILPFFSIFHEKNDDPKLLLHFFSEQYTISLQMQQKKS